MIARRGKNWGFSDGWGRRHRLPTEEQPDIVLVVIDALRADVFDGLDDQRTDWLRNYADRGVRFSGARASAPYTIASINSIFTALYPSQSGVDGWFKTSPRNLRANRVSWVEDLSKVGYYCTAHYETTRRAYAPPWGFSEYQLSTSSAFWDFSRVISRSRPTFTYVHFEGVHDARVNSSFFSKEDYLDSVYRQWHATGAVLEKLRRPGRPEPLLVLIGDHGIKCSDDTWNRQDEVTGRFLTDTTLRTPIIFHWPGRLRPEVVNGLCSTVDLGPTLFDLLGLDTMMWPHQGQSLADQMSCGTDADDRKRLGAFRSVYSLTGYSKTSPWGPERWQVTVGNHRGVFEKGPRGRRSYPSEVFDLDKDPFELKNLVEDKPQVAQALAQDFAQFDEARLRFPRPSLTRMISRWRRPMMRFKVGARNRKYEIEVKSLWARKRLGEYRHHLASLVHRLRSSTLTG